MICIEEDYMRRLQLNPNNEQLQKDLSKLRDEICKIGKIKDYHLLGFLCVRYAGVFFR